MIDKVLFVDDSPRLLSAIRRRLRRHLDITVAESGAEALDILKAEGPFAVIVTDQNMPGMDGVSLLEQVDRIAPQTVRIMMTGQIDHHTAIDAINQGHVFAILSKPCSPEDVLQAVRNGLERSRARTRERNLLEQTLAGSVKLLIDVLSLQGNEIARTPGCARQWVKLLAPRFEHITTWELDLALMLAPLGKITLPKDLQIKLTAGSDSLTEHEKAIIDRCPLAARDLLANIPRLDRIAEAVYYQNAGFDGSGFPGDGVKGRDIPEMARVLHILLHLMEACAAQKESPSLTKAFSDLVRNHHHYDPAIFEVCRETLTDRRLVDSEHGSFSVLDVGVMGLLDGDLLESDVRTVHDCLVVEKGTVLSPPLIQRILQANNRTNIAVPITVMRRTVSSAA